MRTGDVPARFFGDAQMFYIPRRNRMDLMQPAELAIIAAMNAVEEMAEDTRLTEAVILLSQAREKVADFIDGVAKSE
jgi:hypothetical protein